MKLKLFIAFLFLSFKLSSQIQKNFIEVTYYKALKKISDTSIDKPNKVGDSDYTLIASSNKSLFKKNERMENHEIENERLNNKGGGNGVYFKDIINKVKINQKEFNGQTFIIKTNVNQYDWKITKEEKYINNYLCYKATANYKVFSKLRNKEIEFYIIAWFTPEIPNPFGPSGYDGLPGLVLEAQNGSYYFIASKIRFLKNDKDIVKPTKGKIVSESDYNNIIASLFENNFRKKD